MKKGIGPQGLGASKSPAKMYGAKSPAKQTKKSQHYDILLEVTSNRILEAGKIERVYASTKVY